MEKGKILLVDDDISLLKLLSIRLRASGFQVLQSQSGLEALNILVDDRPALIITDLRMAGMDGMALCERVQELYPALPVIILTAHSSASDIAEAKRIGVFDYLTKPFNGKALLASVRAALGRQSSKALSD